MANALIGKKKTRTNLAEERDSKGKPIVAVNPKKRVGNQQIKSVTTSTVILVMSARSSSRVPFSWNKGVYNFVTTFNNLLTT